MVEPGRTCLGDRYELGGLVAAGGMGQVWRGTDVLLGRPVAVKVLRSEYTGDPTFLARFRAEAQNAAALSHPHIACVYDYGETVAQDGSGQTLAYLVMELIQGRPLNEVIRSSGGLDTDTTLRILAETASGLAEAHRAGMVHRDVKPGNILLTQAGDVKITDFGIAWSARSVALTQTGQVLGTPQYISPEQAEGRHASPASDVYALGLIGYECLVGHAAFDGDNAVTIALKQVREEPEPLPEAVPAHVRTLIHRALAKDPAQRFADGATFLAAVEAVRAGRSIDPAPSTVVAPVVPASSAASAAISGPTGRGGAARARRHRAPAGSRPGRPPARRRRSRVAVVLLPLLGLLAGAGIAAMVLQGLAGDGNPPAEAAAELQDDAGVVLREKDYLGRPADEVAVQLAAFGLTVQREARESADAEPGTVIGVEPAGERLEPGATVVIVVATAAGGDGSGSATTSGGGRATAEVTGGTAAASSAPAEEPTTDEETAAEQTAAEDTAAEDTPTESAAATGSPAGDDPAEGSSTPPADPGTEPSDTPSESEETEQPEEPTDPATTPEPAPASSSPAASSSEDDVAPSSDSGGSGSGSAG